VVARLGGTVHRRVVGAAEPIDADTAAVQMAFRLDPVSLQAGGQKQVDLARTRPGAVATDQARYVGSTSTYRQLVRGLTIRSGRTRVGTSLQQQLHEVGRAVGSDRRVHRRPRRIVGGPLPVHLACHRSVGVGSGLQQQPNALGVAGADRGR
jgi:hypothetical protein